MTFLPEPDPVVLGFFFFRRFLYLEILALLALFRVIGGTKTARWPALLALILAIAGIVTTFAPAMGWSTGALYAQAARIMASGGGMLALLIPSGLMILSAMLPGVRWRWIDGAHGALLLALLGLWIWTS